MAINRVVWNGKTLIDLTGDTVSATDLKKGVTAHDKSGAVITGTNTYDSNTQDATAAVAEILSGKTAYVRGKKITGSMPNVGAQTIEITSLDDVSISTGFHDGSGKAAISADQKKLLIPQNIREGITVLGIEGSMSGSEDEKPQTKTITPKATAQTVVPDTSGGYTCFFTGYSCGYSVC